MGWRGRTTLAVVPARGGSKGIPRKNLCCVGPKSLIAHAAATARALDWVDHAVLSTDDDVMAGEGRAHGLDVPFLRPQEFAADDSSSIEMWRHAWLAAESHYHCRFDLSILLQPTTPLRRADEVEHTVRVMTDGGYAAAATVHRVPGHYTPEKCVRVDTQGRMAFHQVDGAAHSLRQTIPAYFSRNGLCYAVTREHLVDRGMLVEQDCAGVVIDRYIVNIDEPYELALANLLYAHDPHLAFGEPTGVDAKGAC